MTDDVVRIDRLVVRVPAGSLPAGAGDEPARRYGRRLADALTRELVGGRTGSRIDQVHVRIAGDTAAEHVARGIADAIEGAVT